jgi:hypothetical protein
MDAVLVFGLYLLPAIVAAIRKHQSFGGIFILNLLLGWTVLGWIVALVWALSHVLPKQKQINAAYEREVERRLSERSYIEETFDQQAGRPAAPSGIVQQHKGLGIDAKIVLVVILIAVLWASLSFFL